MFLYNLILSYYYSYSSQFCEPCRAKLRALPSQFCEPLVGAAPLSSRNCEPCLTFGAAFQQDFCLSSGESSQFRDPGCSWDIWAGICVGGSQNCEPCDILEHENTSVCLLPTRADLFSRGHSTRTPSDGGTCRVLSFCSSAARSGSGGLGKW